MLARGLFHKTLFPPSLVSCLGYRLKTGINSTILQFHKPLLTTTIFKYSHLFAWNCKLIDQWNAFMHAQGDLQSQDLNSPIECTQRIPYLRS